MTDLVAPPFPMDETDSSSETEVISTIEEGISIVTLSSKKQRKSKKTDFESDSSQNTFYKEVPVSKRISKREKREVGGGSKRNNKMTEKDLLEEYLENEWHESNDAIIASMNFLPKEKSGKKEVGKKEDGKKDTGKKETGKKETGKKEKGKKTSDDHFVRPKSKNQEEFANMLKNKANKIIIVTGPAGTGKTLMATEHGIRAFLENEYEKMVFTRPSVSVDEDLGFLPGTLEEKMAPWIRPIYDVLYEHISPKEVEMLIDEKIMEIAPLGFMRGRTFKNTWIVADEMQNSTPSQMKMLLTRLGENSRLIVTGDLEQYDRVAGGGINGLEDFLRRFHKQRANAEENEVKPPASICAFQFKRSDIQREEVVKEVLDIYG